MKLHVPDDRSIRLAQTAAGFGVPQKMIATLLGITEPTLVLHYAEHLKEGKAKAIMQVCNTLFYRATEGKDLGAAIFYLKAQAGWREKHVLDDPENVQKLSTIAALVLASGLNDAPKAPEPYIEGESKRLQ